MAINLQTMAGRVQLDNGTDSEGKQKFVNISLGNLSEERWNDSSSPSKLLAVVGALENVLTKQITAVQIVATSSITAEA